MQKTRAYRSYHYVYVEEISDFNLSMDETIFFFRITQRREIQKVAKGLVSTV